MLGHFLSKPLKKRLLRQPSEMTAIFVVAHMPLATALESCARHVLGSEPDIHVFDIQPNECASESSPRLADAIIAASKGEGVLVLTDLPGATPSNIAVTASASVRERGVACRVLGGVNASMLLKAITYRAAALDIVMGKALAGATQAVLRVD
jgi:mannose PTS system EIIA component